MSNSEYILFFSKNCTFCTDLLNKLYKNDDLLKQIVLININNIQLKIPSFIKNVPSLIVNENNQQHLLVGTEIFNWLEELLKNKEENIKDWDPNTMSGYSDDFSFIEEKETINNDRNYCYISTVNNYKINTPNDDDNNKDKYKKNSSDSAFEKLLAMRKADTPKPISRQ